MGEAMSPSSEARKGETSLTGKKKKGEGIQRGKTKLSYFFPPPPLSLPAAWYWIYQLSKNSIAKHP